jgi:hypothetical protein
MASIEPRRSNAATIAIFCVIPTSTIPTAGQTWNNAGPDCALPTPTAKSRRPIQLAVAVEVVKFTIAPDSREYGLFHLRNYQAQGGRLLMWLVMDIYVRALRGVCRTHNIYAAFALAPVN